MTLLRPPVLRSPDWFRTATRWTQLTFVENDPGRYDPAFWVDVFKRTRSNAVCLSAGGYIAFYPSQVPGHYVSRFLGGKDIFGELVEAARRLGLHVMARVDPHAIHEAEAKAHPAWVQVGRDGAPRRHWAYPDVWVTNAYGEYSTGFMPEVIREIVREYDVDAVFGNRWQGHGVDHGEDSARRFRDASGHALPADQDPGNPAWQAWVQWRRRVLTDVIAQWDGVVKSVRPHASFIPNMSGASLREFDLSVIERHCPFLVVDHQGRKGQELGWAAGRNGKRIRASFPDRPVVLITSVGPEEVYRWKDAVTSGEEIRLWMNDGTIHGLCAWFTKFNGVVPDPRWVPPVVDSFALKARLEPAFEATRPAAEVAVLDPTTTLRFWAREDLAEAERHELGFYHALVEARLPFEMLSDQSLAAETLDRFKVLVLANAACLSDAQCEAVRAYVGRGGSVVAAFETSLRDEAGQARKEFGLADVFGASLAGEPRGIVKNTYVALSGTHPLNAGFEGAARIIGGTRLIDVTPAAGATVPFLYVPDFPDLPMEEVYAREAPRGAATVARETGQGGRVVYIPWNVGEVFWEVLAADHGRLIANAVRWALGTAPRVSVEGPGLIDLALRDGEDRLVLAVMNLTNPMAMKGPARENLPLPAQTVAIAVPPGRQVAAATLLVAGHPVPYASEPGRIVLTLPALDRVEAVEVRWA